jgi:hypothetical protein
MVDKTHNSPFGQPKKIDIYDRLKNANYIQNIHRQTPEKKITIHVRTYLDQKNRDLNDSVTPDNISTIFTYGARKNIEAMYIHRKIWR